MSKNKYKNNDSINRKVNKEFEENELREELQADRPISEPIRKDYRDEEEAIPEEVQQEAVAPSLENERFQRVDTWDNAQTKVRPTADLHATDHVSEGGLGEFKEQLITDGMPREKITEVTDPAAGPDYGTPAPRRGFPWWWILLPLVILGIIWGLTRDPIDDNNPTTTPTTTSKAPIQILITELPDPLASFDLIG